MAEIAAANEMDRKVLAFLEQRLGRVTAFAPHPRWRTGWNATIVEDGRERRLYIRGPRGSNYESPVDMRQEAAIHDAFRANGIPAPEVLAVIDDPYSIVLEWVPGRIDTGAIADPEHRERVRAEFIETIARLHALPVERFAKVGLPVPQGADEIARNLYVTSERIFERLIGRPWPLMRFIGRWLEHNVPRERERLAFINPDAGQFLYDERGLTGLIDFEVSGYGDPAAELAGLRLRDTAEPLGDLGHLYDLYEQASGDRISKRIIEYHTAGFCGVNGFMMWPIAFSSTPAQDYVAYLQFSVATSRWSISAIAQHDGVTLTDPPLPELAETGFSRAGFHLERLITGLPAETESSRYARDSAVALAHYLHRCQLFGGAVLAADLDDAATLLGHRPSGQEEMMALIDAHVRTAKPADHAALTRHFHRWLKRQSFLLQGCGTEAGMAGLDLQPIARRPADDTEPA